jgi:hypothetical protein
MPKRILPLIGMALLSGPLAAQTIVCAQSPCLNYVTFDGGTGPSPYAIAVLRGRKSHA